MSYVCLDATAAPQVVASIHDNLREEELLGYLEGTFWHNPVSGLCQYWYWYWLAVLSKQWHWYAWLFQYP